MAEETIKIVLDDDKAKHIADNGVLDMVIAFDTTGSMSSYIEDVKKHVKELIPELLNTNPDLQLGIVAFGDYCDMVSPTEFGKAYQKIDLTRNENALIEFTLDAKNTSGGDGDEFYELVLKKILDETKWRTDSKKSILLIADAQPHKVGYVYEDKCTGNQIDWREEAKRAISMGIEIDTLSLCTWGEDWYKELSAMTNGVYSVFKTSGKTAEFVKAATWSRGGESTAEYLCAMAADYKDIDSELSFVATNYMVKNDISAKLYDATIKH